MAKIPFDIKFRPQVESGEYKVITAKEQPVRIICWDRSTTYWKIIALVLAPDGRTENPFTYDVDGKESDGCLHNHELDLFLITPEPEPLTKLEKAVFDMLVKRTNEATISEKQARKYGPIFMEIAKDEIYSHESLIEYAKAAKAEGKAEALKDLPRWVKCVKGELIGRSLFYDATDGLLIQPLDHRGYAPGVGFYIFLDDITKLPKED